MENVSSRHIKDRIVQTSSDYAVFKKLKGNRSVLPNRVEKIKRSILRVGYVTNPIIVNERYEVIDGQGRLAALEQLHLPVDYIVVDGIGVEECVSLNIDQTNWKNIDYIDSYCDQGNDNYIRFKRLITEFPRLSFDVIHHAAFGTLKSDDRYKMGTVDLSEEQYLNSKEILTWLYRFCPYIDISGRRRVYLYQALIFCYLYDGINNERLFERIADKKDFISSPSNIDQAFEVIEKIYNERLRTCNHVYLLTEYKKATAQKYSWYATRYMLDYKE